MTIGKLAEQRRQAASLPAQLDALVDYIDREGRPHRDGIDDDVIARGAMHLVADTRRGQRLEMKGIAAAGPRARTPFEHLILSWRPGEVPTAREAEAAIGFVLDETGLRGHGVLWALHRNDRLGNLHLHSVINRVDPATGQVTKVPFSIARSAGRSRGSTMRKVGSASPDPVSRSST